MQPPGGPLQRSRNFDVEQPAVSPSCLRSSAAFSRCPGVKPFSATVSKSSENRSSSDSPVSRQWKSSSRRSSRSAAEMPHFSNGFRSMKRSSSRLISTGPPDGFSLKRSRTGVYSSLGRRSARFPGSGSRFRSRPQPRCSPVVRSRRFCSRRRSCGPNTGRSGGDARAADGEPEQPLQVAGGLQITGFPNRFPVRAVRNPAQKFVRE